MKPFREITDQEWARIAPLLSELPEPAKRQGRPRADRRAVFNGVLWALYTCSPWAHIPSRYPGCKMCHHCFWVWYESGALERAVDCLSLAGAGEFHELISTRTARQSRKRAEAERVNRCDKQLAWYLQCLMVAPAPAPAAGPMPDER